MSRWRCCEGARAREKHAALTVQDCIRYLQEKKARPPRARLAPRVVRGVGRGGWGSVAIESEVCKCVVRKVGRGGSRGLGLLALALVSGCGQA